MQRMLTLEYLGISLTKGLLQPLMHWREPVSSGICITSLHPKMEILACAQSQETK